MNDYRLEVKVRNANILRLMESRGIESVAELCRNAGVCNATFGEIVNLKRAPVTRKGDWHPVVLKVCEHLFVMPSDLFSQEQMEPLKTNKSSVDIGFDDISRLLEDPTQDPSLVLEHQDAVGAVSAALETLTEREQQVINLRFGLDGKEHSLLGVANIFGVTRERIRQIEAKALRKLRNPTRSQPLLLAIYPEEFENNEAYKRAREAEQKKYREGRKEMKTREELEKAVEDASDVWYAADGTAADWHFAAVAWDVAKAALADYDKENT